MLGKFPALVLGKFPALADGGVLTQSQSNHLDRTWALTALSFTLKHCCTRWLSLLYKMEQACPHKIKLRSIEPSFGITPNRKQPKTATCKQINEPAIAIHWYTTWMWKIMNTGLFNTVDRLRNDYVMWNQSDKRSPFFWFDFKRFFKNANISTVLKIMAARR